MNYTEIIINTFAFGQSDPTEIYDLIWNLPFEETPKDPNEIKYKIINVEESVRQKLIDFISKQDIEDYLIDAIKDFHFDVNKMVKGETVPMHNEISQKSLFEIIIWLTKTDDFEGREFVMVKNGKETRIKPKNGMFCMLDTTAPDAFHGVNELITDTEIISITGGTGRRYDRRN